MLQEAVAFCDRFGFEAIELSTFKGLDAARRRAQAAALAQLCDATGIPLIINDDLYKKLPADQKKAFDRTHKHG